MEELYEIKSRFGNFPDYRITKNGHVYSYRQGRILKPLAFDVLDSNGYPSVIICNEQGKRVTIKTHTLVADTFIPNPNNLECINHKDEDKTNNSVDNLEWCTKAYNNTYGNKAVKIGLKLRDSNPFRKPVYQISIDGEIINTYKSVREAARQMGDAKGDSNIHSGIRKHQLRYGYYWQFVTT